MSMSERSEKALRIFNNGFNCAQSVLSVFAPALGLSERDALRTAGAFGGGMARMGNVCGAVTGGMMVVGLFSAKTAPEEDHRKKECYRLTRQFAGQFEKRHGTLDCNRLLGVEMQTDEGFAKARDTGLFETRCPGLVKAAVEILESILIP